MSQLRPRRIRNAARRRLVFALLFLNVLVLGGGALGLLRLQHEIDHLYTRFDEKAENAELATASFSAGSLAASSGDRSRGRELFNANCYACHGLAGKGVPSLGANLRLSKFIASRSNAKLITFIKSGRLPGDPNSLFNGTMPPKGGNAALDDEGLQDVVAYLRSLQENARVVNEVQSTTDSSSQEVAVTR